MAKDQQAALDFYRDLFGWQGKPDSTGGGYAVCELDGKAVAGIGAATDTAYEGVPTVWTSYLASTDVDATQTAIVGAGGTVLIPVTDIGTLGRMLVAGDPQGAVFGVWQPGEFHGAKVVSEPGALTWNELHTNNVHGAAAFYGEVFGLEIAPVEGSDSDWELRLDGRAIGGLTTFDGALPGTPPHWLPYFAVDDIDSTVDALVKAKGTLLYPPTDMTAGRTALATDPQGATFAMIKPTRK